MNSNMQIHGHAGYRCQVIRVSGRIGEYRIVLQRAEHHQHESDAEQETEISDPVHQKGFQIRINRGWPVIPETDQQVGNQADRFPAEE
jgi:hypothetical protein